MKTLLVDIGNSRIKGRWVDSRTQRELDLEPTTLDRLPDDWRPLVDETVDVAIVSNVAHGATEDAFVRWLRDAAPAVTIERVVPGAVTAGLINGYRRPERLGPDRWMALVGARALLPERSLLVCGFGTATTLDLLLHDAATGAATFVGGVILPGIDAMYASLSTRTARLGVPPGVVVDFADNTGDAITSGVMLAQRGALREVLRDARARVHGRLECVVAGGAGEIVLSTFEPVEVVVHHVPDLVLRGLAVIADLRADTASAAGSAANPAACHA